MMENLIIFFCKNSLAEFSLSSPRSRLLASLAS